MTAIITAFLVLLFLAAIFALALLFKVCALVISIPLAILGVITKTAGKLFLFAIGMGAIILLTIQK